MPVESLVVIRDLFIELIRYFARVGPKPEKGVPDTRIIKPFERWRILPDHPGTDLPRDDPEFKQPFQFTKGPPYKRVEWTKYYQPFIRRPGHHESPPVKFEIRVVLDIRIDVDGASLFAPLERYMDRAIKDMFWPGGRVPALVTEKIKLKEHKGLETIGLATMFKIVSAVITKYNDMDEVEATYTCGDDTFDCPTWKENDLYKAKTEKKVKQI